jgi:hypothetical protein
MYCLIILQLFLQYLANANFLSVVDLLVETNTDYPQYFLLCID